MALFIQIQDGQPVNHPAYDINLIQAYGLIPQGWQLFERTDCPVPTIYQVLDSETPTYQFVNGVWTDVWALRDMTNEEKAAKQQAVKDAWAAREQSSNWSAWTFDEATCTYNPPIPRPEPNEGNRTFWCGAENRWKEVPDRPEGEYKFDYFAWTWVAV